MDDEIAEVEKLLNEKKMFTFKQFNEDMGAAPANNAAASPGVEGLDKNVPVSKKAQKKYTAGNTTGIIQPMFKRGGVK